MDKSKDLRRAAATRTFRETYSKTVARRSQISETEAKRIIERLYDTYPEMRAYAEKVKRLYQRQLENGMGPREYAKMYGELADGVVQGTGRYRPFSADPCPTEKDHEYGSAGECKKCGFHRPGA